VHRNRSLIVALSRTDTDGGLLRYASMIARLGTVEKAAFVHVLSRRHESGTGPVTGLDVARTEVEAEVRAHFTDIPESVQTRCEVLEGPLLDRLLATAAASRADALVIGHRHDHPGKWALARRLAMKATCSVWMVPEGSPPEIRRILVPVDFSEHAADTLHVATSLARLVGLEECFILHDYFHAASLDYEGYARVVRSEEDRALSRFLAPLDCQGIRIVPLFEESPSISRLIHRVSAQHRVDLIVMSTRGRSRSSAILLGSVTEDVIITTRIPLLVVKHFGARMRLLDAILDKDFLRKGNVWFD
jgi:nucleotide-binding universal stress UspA family protein